MEIGDQPLLLPPGPHELLILHRKPVRDPIDVIEVGDDLRGVVDGGIVESVFTQGVDVNGANGRRFRRELFRVAAQRLVGGAQRGLGPVTCHLMGERVRLVLGDAKILCDLGTEVVRVRADSVAAAVDP